MTSLNNKGDDMFDSYSSDAMSELDEPIELDPNFWDEENIESEGDNE